MKKVWKIIIGIFATTGVLGIIAAVFLLYFINKVDYVWNGEQLFAAINEHRTSKGIQTLETDPVLCDNLVERWEAIKNPGNAHKGYEEWLKGEGIADNPKYGIIGEMYVKDISTPQNAIAWWVNSPGHRTTLEMKEMKYGCTYASDGTGVVIMATSKK